MRKGVTYLGISMALSYVAMAVYLSAVALFHSQPLFGTEGLIEGYFYLPPLILGLLGWFPFVEFGRYCSPFVAAKVAGISTLASILLITPFSEALGFWLSVVVCLAALIWCSEKCREEWIEPEAHPNRRVAIKITVLVLLVGLPPVAFFWGFLPPKEAELVDQFHQYRTNYERLRAMILEDKFRTVGDYGKSFDWRSSEERGLSQQRADEYGMLMDKADCASVDVMDDGAVSFSMAGWGIANRGWRMNLVWKPMPPGTLLASIDDFQKTTKGWDIGWSQVTDDWYLQMVK